MDLVFPFRVPVFICLLFIVFVDAFLALSYSFSFSFSSSFSFFLHLMFVLISPGSLDRCEDPLDPVYYEIESALRRPHIFIQPIVLFVDTISPYSQIMPVWVQKALAAKKPTEKQLKYL